jgi:aspartyl-tRNA(Asn)/glutamyl-tRNA(Gln) amidotransferase subunit C
MFLNIYLEVARKQRKTRGTLAIAGIQSKEHLCYLAVFLRHFMPLRNQDIDKLCALAQLTFDAGEQQAARTDLDRMIAMIDAIAAVDTSGVEPLAHPLDARARMRPDLVTEQVDREPFQKIAPLTRDGLYLVPRVIE